VLDRARQNVYTIKTVDFTFGSAAAPTPEPATMLLFGTGMAIAVRAARRRRQ
jgi:PEP-CTERM motif